MTRVKCCSVELQCSASISETTSSVQIEQLNTVELQCLDMARYKQQPVNMTIPGGRLSFTTGLEYSMMAIDLDKVSIVESDVTKKYIQLCLSCSSNDIEVNPGPGR